MAKQFQDRDFRRVLRRLSLFVCCVVVFEGLLIAVMPRLHSGSVLKTAKDAMSLRIGYDSWYYMAQGDLAWRQTPRAIYETAFFQRGVRFIYPPTSLLVYRGWQAVGIFHVPPFDALKITMVLSLMGTWLVAAMFFFRVLPAGVVATSSRWERWAVRILLAVLVLTFLPLINAFVLGQVQTLLNFLLIASALLWLRGRRIAAGVMIGLTCWLKPQMALFLLWGMLRRQWSFAVSLASMLALGLGVSLAVFGVHNTVEYLTVLRYLSQHGDALATNQSLNGLLHRVLHVGSPVTWIDGYPPYNRGIYLATILSSALMLAAALVVPTVRRLNATPVDFLLFAMATTMASPIAWEHHYGICFLVFALWMPMAARSWKIFAVLLGSYLLMADNWAPLWLLMDTRWTFLISHIYFGALMLFFWTLFCWREPTHSLSSSLLHAE